MQELWKPVKGYETLYEVSNLGRVKSLDRRTWNHFNKSYTSFKGQEIKPNETKSGYQKVTLYKDRKGKDKLVHRLVAKAFIDNPENKLTVNHKDENRSNNSLDNLEWHTYSENNNHGNRNKTVSGKLKSSKLCKKVYQYQGDELIGSWDSISKCSRETGYKIAGISKACTGFLKSYAGYNWTFTPAN